MNRKVILYSHFGGHSEFEKNLKNSPENAHNIRLNFDKELNKKYLKRFEEMIQVNVDSLKDINDYILASVYIFIDIATYSMVKESKGKLTDSEVKKATSYEKKIIAELGKIEHEARENVINGLTTTHSSTRYMIANYPNFIYIGINQLSILLNELELIEPKLIEFIGSGSGVNFTYDTPKFVESVIRIARGNIKIPCTEEVILRIDEDVAVYYDGIKSLLNGYSQAIKKPFHYFSGSYGEYDNKKNPVDDHPKNNYAVRVHFFIHPFKLTEESFDELKNEGIPENIVTTLNSFKNKEYTSEDSFVGDVNATIGEEKFGKYKSLILNAADNADKSVLSIFFSDLAALGATQKNSKRNYSTNLQCRINKGEYKKTATRKSPEVISGAGLIASPLVFRYLPPFMCFDMPVTWIDDHLKRRLLEVIGFISRDEIESIQEAKFKKNRHPKNITLTDIKGDGENNKGAVGYLSILLSGCMFHSLITDDNEQSTEYSNKVKEIIKTKKLSYDSFPIFREEIEKILAAKYEKVLECWTSDDYEKKPAPGLDVFYNWATIEKEKKTNKSKLVDGLTKDAVRYLELMSCWDIFVSAIDRL